MQPAVWHLALVLSAATFSIGAASVPSLSGCWENELGSILKVDTDGSGRVSGSYQSMVSEGTLGAVGSLVGFYQQDELPTFGFVVRWSSPGTTDSISVWTGQYFKLNGKETLETVWLFRTSVGAERMNWDATRVGKDIFHRQVGGCPK